MATHNTRDPETWSEPPPGTTSDEAKPKTEETKDDDAARPPREPRPSDPIAEPAPPARPEPRRR